MRLPVKIIVVMYILMMIQQTSYAQHSKPDTVQATRIPEKILFDGNPDEAIWESAQHISNFTQRELNFGEPASEKT